MFAPAHHVKRGDRLARLVAEPVRRILQYIPPDLTTALEQASTLLAGSHVQGTTIKALEDVTSARQAWETGAAVDVDLGQLRKLLMQTARDLRSHGHSESARDLLAATIQVGLG